MAAKLAEAMKNPLIKPAELARACDMSIQAVQGWLKTGRIDKKHLPALAAATGRPLEWWLDAPAEKKSAPKVRSFVAKRALDKMTALGAKLSDGDWQLLLTTAEHLAGGAGEKPRNRKQAASR